MSVYEHPDTLDKGLEEIQGAATRVILCEGFPATYAEATTAPATGKALADVAVTSGDWTIDDGDPDGRAITLGAKTGVPIDNDGDGDHFATVDDDASRLLLVTEADDSYSVTDGQTATFKGFTHTRRAATLAA